MAARRTAWAWVAVALLASAELPPAMRRAQLRGSSNASEVRRLQSSSESSLTFTVGSYNAANGLNGYLYVKLWSGTTLIPLSGCVHMTVVEAFPEKITTTSMTGDRRFFNVDMSPRPSASGYIDETGSVHTGQCTFPDDRTYLMYYHPDTHIIYWDVDEGTHTWTPSSVGQSTSSCDPASATVSVPTYSGSCSTAYRDNDWSGPNGWLKLDDIDVSARGITSSQSLGSLDPTLPLTHIEFYYTSANGLRIGDVSIQVGGTQYGLPAGWDSYANYALLETDSCPKWWMEIEMRFLSSPAPSPRPTPQPTPGPSPEPTPEPTPEEPAVEMERVRRMRDMDAELHSRREELLDKLRKRTEEYNALIVDPRLRWELV